jgi:hypothetical protein
MIIKINSWFGRLGNNIIQLLNVIQIARYYNYKIFIPKHPYFNTKNNLFFINKLNKKIITDRYNFFYDKKIQNIDKKTFNNENLKKSIEIVKNIFTIKNIPKLDEKDIIIHIRSGDIFCVPPKHQGYIMPPLSFYKKILDNNNFNNIIIIAENKFNPIIDKILQLYPNIKFKIQSLKEDITLLLGSSNVVESFGTFTASLLLLSDNIKNIYKPNYQVCLIKNIKKVNIIETDLDSYHKKLLPWKNTKKQREIMLNS